jgi:hypothetical protein
VSVVWHYYYGYYLNLLECSPNLKFVTRNWTGAVWILDSLSCHTNYRVIPGYLCPENFLGSTSLQDLTQIILPALCPRPGMENVRESAFQMFVEFMFCMEFSAHHSHKNFTV